MQDIGIEACLSVFSVPIRDIFFFRVFFFTLNHNRISTHFLYKKISICVADYSEYTKYLPTQALIWSYKYTAVVYTDIYIKEKTADIINFNFDDNHVYLKIAWPPFQNQFTSIFFHRNK